MTTCKQYLRATEIAGLTGVSVRTVRRWIADEILPSTKLGGARLVAMEALECLLPSAPADLPELSENTDENDS